MELPDDDFKRLRDYLPDDAFLIPDGREHPPTDPAREADWRHALDLPTDVALFTTDLQGSVLGAMHDDSYEFLCAIPTEPQTAPFMHEPAEHRASRARSG